jgi:hypothetical protein
VAEACSLRATTLISNKTKTSSPEVSHSHSPGPRKLVNRRLQHGPENPTKPQLDHWHTGCKSHARREATRIASWSSRQTSMKAKNTNNLASVVMLVILSPFLALAILVSIQTAGIRDNEILLVLLTLSSAVLSGINGFGRRTPAATPLRDARLHLSARSSNNA